MKQIRHGTFETNSSSTHSLVLTNSLLNIKRNIVFENIGFGEYGWGYEELKSPEDKISYLITLIQYEDDGVKAIRIPAWDDPKREELEKEYSDAKLKAILNSKYFIWIDDVVLNISGKKIELEKNVGYYDFGYIDHQSLEPNIFYKSGNDIFSMNEKSFKEFIKELIFTEKYFIAVDNDNH
jgi:hypothetical protein